MGLFAPFGPRLASRLGPRLAFAACIALIAGFGAARSVAPNVPLILLATFGVGRRHRGRRRHPVDDRGRPDRDAARARHRRLCLRDRRRVDARRGPRDPARHRRPVARVAARALDRVPPVHRRLARRCHAAPAATPPRPRFRAVRLPWRSRTAWILVLVFGLQSMQFYGVSAWIPNVYIERGWTVAAAGALVAVFNGVGLFTTIGVPLVADRLGARRRPQLVLAAVVGTLGFVGIALVPEPAYLWVAILGLALGSDLPAGAHAAARRRRRRRPGRIRGGADAARRVRPVVHRPGAPGGRPRRDRQLRGEPVAAGAGRRRSLAATCLLLSPERLRRGIGRA